MTEKELALETSKLTPKYLVVDRNIVRTNGQEGFAGLTRLPVEAGIFVGSYEGALEVVRSDAHIVLVFVDIGVPKGSSQEELTKKGLIGKNSKKNLQNEWGIKLLSQIKDIPTFIYYSSADKFAIRTEAARHENVIGCTIKPFAIGDLQVIKPYREKYFPPEKYASLSSSFDYSSLDEETLTFVQLRTEEIKRLARKSSQDVIDIGTYLIEIKEKFGYGKFYDWIEVEFSWSSRTAVRFMRVAKRFRKYYDRLADLNILPIALYALAPISVPDEAVAEAFARAEQGETISEKTAQGIKARYKALKEQADSKVELKKVKQIEPERTKNRESRLSVADSQPSSGLPEKKDTPKQEILAVVPSQNAVKNSWWQLGEHHRLFCGEPKNQEFLKRLPKDIGLSLTFLPKNDLSLVPSIESIFSLAFQSKYDDLDLDLSIKTLIRTTTKPNEIVIFNYIYYIELLELAEKLGCYFWVAEPDLEKCEQILTMWRKKGSVKRMNS